MLAKVWPVRRRPLNGHYVMPLPPPGVWHVEAKRTRRFWRRYHLVAVAQEQGDTFRLECLWAQCLYILKVEKNGRGADHVIFIRSLFADADLDKYVGQIMRIASHDIENRLARVDRRQKDGGLGPRWHNPPMQRTATASSGAVE